MPKIIPASDKGWKILNERVGISHENKSPSSDFESDFDGEYNNFNFYCFRVKNAPWNFLGLRRSKAEIKLGKMGIYDAQKNLVKKDIPVRYTSVGCTAQNPLFTGNFIGYGGFAKKQEITLGDNEELDLVLACNKSGVGSYYIFTANSDVAKMFPADIDRFPQSMPCYMKIEISGHKLNSKIFLLLEEDENNELVISCQLQ